jgi:1-acyl-sn-glycerol-3-phosphate acyltransferase
VKRSKAGTFLQRAAHALLLRPFLKVFCGVNVIGRSNLRGLDRFIIVSNHNSHFDVMLLFYILPLRLVPVTHPVADLPYFSRSSFVKRLVDFLFDPVWIVRERDKRVSDPLEDIGDRLDGGRNIVIFPEGTRGEPGEMRRFKPGIGRLSAERPDIPVVAVFLSGPERALPKRSSVPLPFWQHVVVSPPQKPRGTSRDITASLEQTVIELSNSDAVQRQKRRASRAGPAPMISILGIDGSGKSTQAQRLAQALSRDGSASVISDAALFFENGEPRNLQPLLTEAIRSAISVRAKKAGSLKSYKIPKLADLFLRDHLLGEIGRWYRPDVTVMDGSPLLNIVAWSALYKPSRFDARACTKIIDVLTGGAGTQRHDPVFDDFPELRHLKRLHLTHLRRPDVVVFLDVDPAAACQRIESRGEHRQVHETADKLGKLRSAYLDVCDVVEHAWRVPTARVDGNRGLDVISDEIADFCQRALERKESNVGSAH